MRNWLIALFVLTAAPAAAQITAPYTFTAGTVANPDEVNANFAKFADALNRTGGTMTGTLTSRSVIPSATNTYDLGSVAALFQTGYLRTSLVLGQTAGNYTLTWANPAAARAISIADPGGTDVFTFNAATQTLTNKTLTSPTISGPTLSGTITGTYTLGGTSNAALLGAANTFSAANPIILGAATTGTLRTDQAGYLTMQSGSTGFLWRNNANNATRMTLTDAGVLDIFAPSPFNALNIAGWNALGWDGTSALKVGGYTAATWQSLNLYTAGVLRWGINAAGDHTFGASSHIADSSGTPSITSGFGASATIAGNDYGFVITEVNLSLGGTVTFGHTFSAKPSCTASGSQGNLTISISSTTTTVSVSHNNDANSQLSVQCRGY